MKVNRLPRPLRVISAIMALMFLFGLVVQYNDPDPLPWVAIYGAAALASLAAARGHVARWLPGLVALISIVWSAALLPGVAGAVRFTEMFEEFEMKSVQIEQAREGFGLLIIALWMVVLFIVRPRPATDT